MAHDFFAVGHLADVFGGDEADGVDVFEACGEQAFRYSTLYSVGMKSGNPCQASRGHSTNFTVSI